MLLKCIVTYRLRWYKEKVHFEADQSGVYNPKWRDVAVECDATHLEIDSYV